MPYVLDTDTISLLERGDRALREHIAALPAEDVFVTVVSLEEQMRGRLSTRLAVKAMRCGLHNHMRI